jgi:hypothetical protein
MVLDLAVLDTDTVLDTAAGAMAAGAMAVITTPGNKKIDLTVKDKYKNCKKNGNYM